MKLFERFSKRFSEQLQMQLDVSELKIQRLEAAARICQLTGRASDEKNYSKELEALRKEVASLRKKAGLA